MRFELITRAQGPVLDLYRKSRARNIFIMGPLGSGKTFESCQKIFGLMCTQKPNRQGLRKSRWYAIRNTYPDLLSTTVKDWLELFGELGRYKGGGMEPPSHTLRFRLKDKTVVQTEIVFLALDRPLSIKKLRGAQVTGFWLNEAKELEKAVVDMADLRHGRYPSMMDGGPSWHGMIGDTNAPDDDSWYYELSEEVKPEGWEFYKQPGGVLREMRDIPGGKQEWTGKWVLNPDAENLHNLPPDYYSAGMEGKSEAWIAVNLGNEYGSVHDGKAIYAEQWNDTLHTSDAIHFIPDHPLEIGLDFGLTPSAVFGQLTPRGRVNILAELCGVGMGINQFVKTLLKPFIHAHFRKASEITYIGDPAGNKRAETNEVTVFKELYGLGIEALAANSNDPEVRWEAVRWFLEQMRDGKPAFTLHPDCKLLRKGFNGGYQLRKIQVAGSGTKESRFHVKADKNKFSHPHDGLQYLCMYYRGDYVVTSYDFERDYDEDAWGVA